MTGTILALLSIQKRIPTNGIVKTVNISIWEDINCTIPLTSIDWGIIETIATNNMPYLKTIYITSESTVPITVTVTVENILPDEFDWLVWALYQGNNQIHSLILQPNETVNFDFALAVMPYNPITNFSFDIIITGTEI